MPNVRLKDIANIVGVSQNTVSLVLRGKKGIKETTRQEILRVANELGYIFKTTRSIFLGNIGVILSLGNSSNVYFHSQVLEELEIIMRAREYNIVLINNTDSSTPESLHNQITMNKVKGVVFLGVAEEWAIQTVVDCNLPFIATGFFSFDRVFDCVLEDNVTGTLMVMRHLDKLGYRNIGFVGAVHSESSFYERYMVYNTYLQLNPALHRAPEVWIDYSFEQLTDSAFLENLIAQSAPLPEVFFCANDKIAAVLLKALRSHGFRIPEDIGLIGFDNSELAQLSSPTLSSVDTYFALQAKRTATEIIRKVEMNENKSTIGRILTKVKLIEGNSLRKIQRP